jgi:hypothetical protein
MIKENAPSWAPRELDLPSGRAEWEVLSVLGRRTTAPRGCEIGLTADQAFLAFPANQLDGVQWRHCTLKQGRDRGNRE